MNEFTMRRQVLLKPEQSYFWKEKDYVTKTKKNQTL